MPAVGIHKRPKRNDRRKPRHEIKVKAVVSGGSKPKPRSGRIGPPVRSSNSGGLRVKPSGKTTGRPKGSGHGGKIGKGTKPKPKFRTVTRRSYQPFSESDAGSSSSSENMSQRRLVVTKIKQRIDRRKNK